MERLRLEQCKNCNDYNGCMTHCFNICGKPLDALEEFNKYKDLEEQGKLLKLPCAVGDTVWCVHMYSGGGRVPNWGEVFQSEFSIRMYDDFGKTVFFTKSAAEQALKEMEEKK